MHSPQVQSPVPHKIGIVTLACNPKVWELKAGGSEVQGPLQLISFDHFLLVPQQDFYVLGTWNYYIYLF